MMAIEVNVCQQTCYRPNANFGARAYEGLDKTRGEFFHTHWTGRGGKVSTSNYDV